MTTLQFFTGLLDWLLADPSHIVAAAAALAAATPTPDPATLWGKAYTVVDLLALNFLHAKDTGQPSSATPPAPPSRPPAAAAVALLLAAGLTLAACADQPPATTVFGIRAAYDASVLVPMAAYARLPGCPAATATPSTAVATPVCADPTVLTQLTKADTAAKAALDAAETTVRAAPDMDAGTAIAAAENAVAAVQTILTTYNIH